MSYFVNNTLVKAVSATQDALNGFKIPIVSSLNCNCEIFSKLADYFANRSASITEFISSLSGLSTHVVNGNVIPVLDTDIVTGEDDDYDLVVNAFEGIIQYIDDNGATDGAGNASIAITLGSGDIVSLVHNDDHVSSVDKDGNQSTFIQLNEDDSYSINSSVLNAAGIMVPFEQVLGSLVTNSELLDLYTTVASGFSGGSPDLSAITSLISSFIGSSSDAIVNEGKTLCSVIVQGGSSGVLSYLMGLYSTIGSATYDDGDIVFSKNADLMPVDFLTGIVQILPSLISTVGTVIAAVINPVFGLITGAISSFVSYIVPKIQYAFDTALSAHINDSGNVMLLPFNCGSGTIGKNFKPSVQSVPAACDLGCIFRISYPGVDLLCYRKTDNSFYYEIHPDMVDRRYNLGYLLGHFDSWTFEQSSDPYYPYLATYKLDLRDLRDEDFENLDDASIVPITNDPDTQVLSEDDDVKLRWIATTNIFIFMMYLYMKNNDTKPRYLTMTFKAVDSTVSSVHLQLLQEVQGIPIADWSDQVSLTAYWNIAGSVFIERHEGFTRSQNCPQWSTLIQYSDKLGKLVDSYDNTVLPHISDEHFDEYIAPLNILSVNTLSSYSGFSVDLPKYNRATFLRDMLIIAGTAVVVAAATTAIAVTVRVKLNRWATKRAAVVESLWSKAVADPTAENVNAYNKARVKNNLLSNIFGGTKFSKTSFWDSGSESSLNSEFGISSIVKLIKG